VSFLFFVVAAVALIWGLNLALRVSPLLACGLYLVIAGCTGYEFFHFTVGGVTLSLDRIALLGTIGAFFVQQKLGRTSCKPIAFPDLALFAFFGLLIGNTYAFGLQSTDPEQVAILPHLIQGYVIPLVLYGIGYCATVHEKGINRLYGILAAFGIYLSLTALFEIAGVWELVFPKIVADPERGIHFGRARGPFLQSVRLGMYLWVGMAAVWIPLVWRGIWGRHGRILGVCLTPLFLAALAATLTRSVWAGTALAALVLVLLTLSGRPRRAVVWSMFAVAIVAALFIRGGWTSFQRETGAVETKQSTHMRAVFAYVSWLMIKEKPLQGHGFGHFPHKKDDFLNDRRTDLEMESIRGYIHHNTFLSILVELGVFGLLFFAVVVSCWTCRAWRLWRDWQAPDWMRGQALLLLLFLPYYALQMMFHDVSYSPMENGLLFLMAGLTSSLFVMRGHRTEQPIPRPMTACRRPPWRSALGAE
jgi:O-antigen ligase